MLDHFLNISVGIGRKCFLRGAECRASSPKHPAAAEHDSSNRDASQDESNCEVNRGGLYCSRLHRECLYLLNRIAGENRPHVSWKINATIAVSKIETSFSGVPVVKHSD